jgi:hypothetical protein
MLTGELQTVQLRFGPSHCHPVAVACTELLSLESYSKSSPKVCIGTTHCIIHGETTLKVSEMSTKMSLEAPNKKSPESDVSVIGSGMLLKQIRQQY